MNALEIPPLDLSSPWTRNIRLSDAVYDLLEELIETKRLLPGTRLPSERDLASRLGVSRTSVREAILELQLKGLVDRRVGRGTIVLTHEGGPGEFLLENSDEKLALVELMDFRRVCEPETAALAAVRRTTANLGSMSRLIDAMAEETKPSRIAQLDRQFHFAIATATHNSLLIRLHELSGEWLQTSRRGALQSARRRHISLDGHRRIFEAIRDGQANGARSAATDHITDIAAIVLPR